MTLPADGAWYTKSLRKASATSAETIVSQIFRSFGFAELRWEDGNVDGITVDALLRIERL